MRLIPAVCLSVMIGALLIGTRPAQALEVRVLKTKLESPAVNLSADENGPVVELNSGKRFRIRLTEGRIAVSKAAKAYPPSLPVGALPDTELVIGTHNIRYAWLARPTDRYGHGVLGDAIEAGAVVAELAAGTTAGLTLGPDAVFEDRVPRLADLDGDGFDEILLIKSYLDAGGALVVVTERHGALRIAAEAPPIGLANRWLNPVGVGDFDGDGRKEAAVVITPHIGGTLQLYEWRGDRLVEDHSRYGFSNHAMGSRELGLAVVTDWNGDGTPDMIVPDAARRRLIGLSFAGGTYRELFRHDLADQLATGIIAIDLDNDGHKEIIFGLDDGTLTVLAKATP